nr:GAF domain-containing sensor histidine kinase [Candidatus Levybacteria bacterium]
MSFLEISTILSTVFFAVITLLLSIRQRKISARIQKQEEKEKQRLYQISILKEIQDRIGYSLDTEKVIDVITGSLEHLFPYSTTSSIVIKNNKLLMKTHVEQTVNSSFILQVKKTMLASLQALVPNLPIHLEEMITGVPLDEAKTAPVKSFFNIPLAVGNDIVGLINVSSSENDSYKEDEITILYQIVAQASNALSKLQDVLDTEKGKLTAMISSLADGVFMVDTHKNLLIINSAASSFLGIASKTPGFTDILTATGTQYDFSQKIDEALQKNQLVEEKEITINDKIFQAFITPVQGFSAETSKPIGASILLHDITIERNVTRIKEDFTHMIVHELRAPLTAIKDSAELMIEVYDEKGTLQKEQQRRLLQIIDRQSKDLLEQINQVLDAAKIEAGRFSIEKVSSDLPELIQNAIEPFMPQAGKKQITISTDIYYPLPKVEVDPVRIGQVLNNLISNSLKFTPANGKIVVSAKTGDGFVTISVADNGMGIAENDQKDLFSKYYQIRTTPHQLAKKGTGLGLFIIKGIVEAHGGSVGVDSKLGQGTTIYFTLPFEGVIKPEIIQGHLPQPKLSPSSMVN